MVEIDLTSMVDRSIVIMRPRAGAAQLTPLLKGATMYILNRHRGNAFVMFEDQAEDACDWILGRLDGRPDAEVLWDEESDGYVVVVYRLDNGKPLYLTTDGQEVSR